jgi:hypothetical protein
MSHLPTCRTRKERFGLIWVEYSEPDHACKDESHNTFYFQGESE